MAVISLERYTILSLGVWFYVLYHTIQSEKQFYHICVSLVTDRYNQLATGNFIALFTIAVGKLLQRMFLGELRLVEHETLFERLFYSVLDLLLFVTIFTRTLTMQFFGRFCLLLLGKVFHGLISDRIRWLDQTGSVSTNKHIRLFALMLVLQCVDFFCLGYAVWAHFEYGPSDNFIFAFEYFVLNVKNLLSFTLYGSFWYHQWKNMEHSKPVVRMYVEFVSALTILCAFVAFFYFFYSHFGHIPLIMIRDIRYTFYITRKRFDDIQKYRQTVRNLKDAFWEVDSEALANLVADESICIICREGLSSDVVQLGCEHCFHLSCILSWATVQGTCPLCLASILESSAKLREKRAREAKEKERERENEQISVREGRVSSDDDLQDATRYIPLDELSEWLENTHRPSIPANVFSPSTPAQSPSKLSQSPAQLISTLERLQQELNTVREQVQEHHTDAESEAS